MIRHTEIKKIVDRKTGEIVREKVVTVRKPNAEEQAMLDRKRPTLDKLKEEAVQRLEKQEYEKAVKALMPDLTNYKTKIRSAKTEAELEATIKQGLM